VRAALPALLLSLALAACGEGGSPPSSDPPPSDNPGQSPCVTALEAGDDFVAPDDTGRALPGGRNPGMPGRTAGATQRRPLEGLTKTGDIDGTNRWRVFDDLWRHRQAAGLRERQPRPRTGDPAATVPRENVDIGEIAVLNDQGDLIAPANPYDLRNTGLGFTRNGAGGYDVRRIDGTFRGNLGTRLTLTDDDSTQADVPFGFPFYGATQRTAFVNSDGNVTFGEGDQASTERNVSRLLTGPPRVSPFLADLDPTTGSGRVFVNAANDQYTVTWCGVRGFDSQLTTNVQTTLLPDGSIEMRYGAVTLSDAVVGISPGRTGDFLAVNLGEPGPTGGGSGAVGERFAGRSELDVVAVTQKFYQSHGDNFDQLVIWTDTTLIRDAFAYETTIANEVRGLGIDIYDLSRDFGSGGRLRSLAVMDWLGKYPADPTTRFLGENNTLSVLGQEVGHRWLAFFDFRNHDGQRSDLLLGRGLAHWSFFMDSDASVMEGNDIQDLGGGSFRTTGAVQRYSRLDQYAMGLVSEAEVPTFFYVDNVTNVLPLRDRDSGPDVDVTFNGTRRDVLIQDIVAIHGPRSPSSAESPRVHRQAFVYVVGAGRSPEGTAVDKLDRIRREWEGFFLQATENRMRADTRLNQ
jgi:hypothetical protein